MATKGVFDATQTASREGVSARLLQTVPSLSSWTRRAGGWKVDSHKEDRGDVPIQWMFKVAQDPDVGGGTVARGERVGPRARMPGLPPFYSPEQKLRFPERVAT